jgi:hypothetical protein
MFISGPWEAASTNKMLGIDIKPDQKMFVGYGDYQEAYQAFIQGLVKLIHIYVVNSLQPQMWWLQRCCFGS